MGVNFPRANAAEILLNCIKTTLTTLQEINARNNFEANRYLCMIYQVSYK